MAKTGRPSTYDPAVATKICEQLSEGISLREICRQEGMPPWQTVYSWMERDASLVEAIARAREIGYDAGGGVPEDRGRRDERLRRG
jgi:hypothetical protein